MTTGSWDIDPSGNVVIEYDGITVLDTSLDLMNLIPDEAIVLTGQAISFPSLYHGTIYHQTRVTVGPSDLFGCAAFAGLVAQEWGPGRANSIADTVVGTVPPGVDYLDVFCKLAWTSVPPGWIDTAMRSNMPQNQWVKLEGGSCRVEHFPGMRRLFEFVLDPAGSPAATRNVLLRRYQSVTANGQVGRSYSHGLGNVIGFIAGSGAPTSGGLASYGALLQTKGPSGGQNHRPPGAPISQDPCTTSGTNYASTWTGDIIITPGRIGA